MAKNDFKAFAIGENANTLSQEEYESSDFIEEGFKSGIARSERLNKVWRQSSVIAAVIGKYIAEKTGEDVMDDGDLEKLVTQLDLALKHKITTEIPDASLAQKGISQLNSATNSDREDQAATLKAVHDVRKIAESKLSGVSDASLTQKGIVQLSSATNSASETLAATPKAIKEAYDFANTANVAAKNAHDEANKATDNANSRLAKNQNGADIPNKSEFIKNLGLTETVELAKSAANINTIYPIGIVVWFAQNKNPNALFPGTTWKYIGENRTVRLAAINGSNVLSTGGRDSVNLTADNLPAHTHSFSGTTSSFDYGTKTTNTTGNHSHNFTAPSGQFGNPVYDRVSANDCDDGVFSYNKSGWISSAGAHSHTVSIGAHIHTISGITGNTGHGQNISVANAYVMLMAWYRIS
ncbi:tail fiber protein [Photorhabdus akhurstii]|uniref:tail fiber protein n=1 Tax=Photorhabdus akhurstii TaxID=171438 RepID=UPI003703EE41